MTDQSPVDADPDPESTGAGGRDVVVPLRLYKTVVVFSTLIAVVSVVLGFTLLDAATLQVSLVRGLVVGVLSAVGFVPAEGALSATLAAAGLATIALGAGVYTLGTRFRTAGMGNAEDGSNRSEE